MSKIYKTTMNDNTGVNDFNRTIDVWINELERYSLVQLCRKPSSDSWSLGQLYMHLIEATQYFIEQINICLSNTKNATKDASPVASFMFANNSFPDKLLEGPPSNAKTPQPENKDQIVNGLLSIKHELNRFTPFNVEAANKGKTKHFGLGYFTSAQWLQFADMHLRHHFRQKERIDAFLKANP